MATRQFNCSESPSTEQVRLSSHRSSLLASDRRHELKGKMAMRQSARCINFTESVHTNGKKEKKHKFVGISQDNIRRYNSMFAFTSMGGKQDMSVNVGRGAVSDGETSSFRNNELNYQLTTDIRDLLDEINQLVQDFRVVGERIRSSDDEKISLRLIVIRQGDGRQYNLPTASEVVALIVGDFDSTKHKRGIILHCQDGDFKRIGELHPSYLPLHYPLFFPYGEDNYRSDIFHERVTDYDEKNKGTRVTMKQGLKSEDRPDVISRVFKIKLDCLMKELNDGHIFGLVKRACHRSHDAWSMRCCNPSCPCTIEYKCTKKFPRQFNETTMLDDSGYALYKRRNDGNIIKKSGTYLHNGYVVPYNPGLLRRYQAYINVKWCNQVIFDATESIDYAVDKSFVNETKFESWMELNQTDTFARTLLYVEIPKFYDDLKKVDDVLYPTYRDAYYARGLLQDDKEYIDGILEASLWRMGDYLRSIFVMLIMTDSMSRLEIVWEKTWMKLAEDVLNVERIKQGIPDLKLSDIQRKNICVSYIECMLRSNNRSLKDIQNMPYPDHEYTMDRYNRLIYDETSYDKDQLREQHVKLYGSLTTEQKAALRSKGDIVLNVAASGIAPLLLEGGRTTHSCFAIPINIVEDSMCHIAGDSDLANLLCKANLVIWDKAPMINMQCYEAFDRTLRDICRTDPFVAFDKVFGGKVVLFGGDFKQILPVITNGGRQDVLDQRNLKKEIQEFANWILEIGNGKVGGVNDGESTIVFPDNMLIPETNDDVGDENEYESSDSVCLADEDLNFDDSIYTTEFLNGLRMSGIPNHSIKLKI
nr:hypothetical protein [Tanacetum cinerariifolium]